MQAFCDWLDVTYSPVDFPSEEVSMFLQSWSGASLREKTHNSACWTVGDGLVRFDARRRYARISASGAALAHLRVLGVFEEYLITLASSAHKVTRLDAAVDLPLDGADVVSELRARYPTSCSLSRKGQRVSSLLSPRDSDGRETGTWYVGHRAKGEVTARVYDKAHEAWQKRGEKLPPTTRYEITVRKGYRPTLRDASAPDRIFWHFASPSLLQRPWDMPEWSSFEAYAWDHTPDELPPGAILKNRIETSPDLAAIVSLAKRYGPQYERFAVSQIGKLFAGSILSSEAL